jgi:hypothetical protein
MLKITFTKVATLTHVKSWSAVLQANQKTGPESPRGDQEVRTGFLSCAQVVVFRLTALSA